MVADARVTYRRRNPYTTRTNYIKKVRTPGNRLVVQYLKKLHLKHRSIPRCAETGRKLRGVLPNRGNYKNKRLSELQKNRKSVSRAYGGNLCHQAVRRRIIRAFLSEETRIISKVRKVQKIKKAERKKLGTKKKSKKRSRGKKSSKKGSKSSKAKTATKTKAKTTGKAKAGKGSSKKASKK
mmetsp:Transcript_50218/g.79968  ORF Transcript_50218/g.79968 Transcript_50218/m.79968 type:complete len:181 (+) Transcript_50218:94-636(+)|eukprot:CAMPEP_0197053658 /NCGR_PEP_ID=MMETSP1384-20130603/27875_1 /TAXON_ID=29189 /ORGANISM="Ammonia sp." /LENGTH=180 /DNA_ID=CAMNT_0042486593 /DNA_START=118 /DNA_END=660 /DNA_ORIENTATION=+